ncbi:MAG: glycoside hydrolase, partial [Bacteroidetes bacterium]
LHSKDLVNWKIVNYVFQKQIPEETFNKPQHGNGVWAPSIRFHDGFYYIYYGDPDFGIYMVKTKDPEGQWEKPHLVKEAKGWIDPSPLWDDDGKAYLVHAFAGSRSSIKSILVIHEMSPDGRELLSDGVLVFDGHDDHPTIEGPKFYKRNDYYYIFAPAGGVPTGWQTVLRSKNIYGPYEDKIVMHQGNTDINGPHQGGWVTLNSGEDWFIHFQDKDAYGRIVHLQPMTWKDDWCVIGEDKNGDGIGEPVATYRKPQVGVVVKPHGPQTSDDFSEPALGLQWQWHANPEATRAFVHGSDGFLRLYAKPMPEGNLWNAGNLLLQKFPAPEFSAVTKLSFHPNEKDPVKEKISLLIMGRDYAYVTLEHYQDHFLIKMVECINAEKGTEEKEVSEIPVSTGDVFLKVKVSSRAMCQFAFSTDGIKFKDVGTPFKAREGKWIGAKVGLFASGTGKTNDSGYADIDWFEIRK